MLAKQHTQKNTIHFAVYNSHISKNCVALWFSLTLHFFYNPQIKVSAQNSYTIFRFVNVFLKYCDSVECKKRHTHSTHTKVLELFYSTSPF